MIFDSIAYEKDWDEGDAKMIFKKTLQCVINRVHPLSLTTVRNNTRIGQIVVFCSK